MYCTEVQIMNDETPLEQQLPSLDDKKDVVELGQEKENEYGDLFYSHLLEEYKLYVEMMDRVSGRRIETNKFYISILTALLGFIATLGQQRVGIGSDYMSVVLLLFIGLCLCVLWFVNINSYKQLNSLKFDVIREMESHLPFPCYSREWEVLQRQGKAYQRLSVIERYMPFLVSLFLLGKIIHISISVWMSQ
jgi:hypothetical protein